MELMARGERPTVGAYYYCGWHRVSGRPHCLTEWELVVGAVPRFRGHMQPHVPLLGPYDDSSPATLRLQKWLARSFGIDFFCFGVFWDHGVRYLEAPLDGAFLREEMGPSLPFCVMWANRLPRKVLPVRVRPKVVIEESRRVRIDIRDFLSLVMEFERLYFSHPDYVTMEGAPLFLIFDSTFFIRELGIQGAREAIKGARDYLIKKGYPRGLYLVAVNPVLNTTIHGERAIGIYGEVGFDAITHYVYLPHWKGEYLQDYVELMEERAKEWGVFKQQSQLPYFPSVATGWDATPRAAVYKNIHPRRYPWWPVVVGNNPVAFGHYLGKALDFSRENAPCSLAFVASWNEWSEGHYLEPCTQWGFGWLSSVRAAKGV